MFGPIQYYWMSRSNSIGLKVMLYFYFQNVHFKINAVKLYILGLLGLEITGNNTVRRLIN